MNRWLASLLAGLMAMAGTAVGTPSDWALPEWSARTVLRIIARSPDAACDTAGATILLQGAARPDGADLRVLDAAGKPQPFQVLFLDASRYALIVFRAAPDSDSYTIYSGNPAATRAKEEVVANPRPGAGAPQAAWIPRWGLVLQTWRRPSGPNPASPDEMAALLAASPGPDGARFQRAISDGFNSFGWSDFYISCYRGWLRIPHQGRYAFCNVSNEGSFSFLDGQALIHWPGRHTSERGKHGEMHTQVTLDAGMHYVEYYQEEVTLEQMAFLGWQPPGAGREWAIPESVFPPPHRTEVVACETRAGGRRAVFEPRVRDSIWPETRATGQYTRVEVRAAPGSAEGAWRWDFGDGQNATGRVAEHVYAALGRYTVRAAAADGAPESWPLNVYELQQVTPEFGAGDLAAYARVAADYDLDRIPPADLPALASLYEDVGDWTHARAAGERSLRAAGGDAGAAAAMRLRLPAWMARTGAPVNAALDLLLLGMAGDSSRGAKLAGAAALLSALSEREADTGAVERVFSQVEDLVRGGLGPDPAERAAVRQALIGHGDALLAHGQTDAARDAYQRAEALRGVFMPASVRAARVGGFGDGVRSRLAEKDLEGARRWIEAYEDLLPTEKLSGVSFFWRGRMAEAGRQWLAAAGYYRRYLGTAPGATEETEARWRLAEVLAQSGDPNGAHQALTALVATGIQDSFVDQARKRLGGK